MLKTRVAGDADELRALREAVKKLLQELDAIAAIADDAERGRAFRREMRRSKPIFLVLPRPPRPK